MLRNKRKFVRKKKDSPTFKDPKLMLWKNLVKLIYLECSPYWMKPQKLWKKLNKMILLRLNLTLPLLPPWISLCKLWLSLSVKMVKWNGNQKIQLIHLKEKNKISGLLLNKIFWTTNWLVEFKPIEKKRSKLCLLNLLIDLNWFVNCQISKKKNYSRFPKPLVILPLGSELV